MINRRLTGLAAAIVAAALALSSPALARGGGGGHGGFGGGGHFGGGMHAGGFGGGMRGGGMHVGGMGGARFAHVGGPGFGGARFAHAAIGPRFAGAGWHGRPFIGRHAFFHHRHFRRFAVFGAPFAYAAYNDGCWRRSWTPYGWQWVNVCGDSWY
ncbi:hypothetical protein IVB18_05520 [Bradyrhizobium sp. 186]|uniref:hypothetical protein n=1 Tax=Bradyrhizobium sp. 186 TaxID=2782654 RepID=UPI0020015637|nr:hypothetical protein [Bradyrhizobium sp. 186]UPK36809.1 hypothetical protein IVB18_05520 [Bradyrhizobium sp. 186]